MKPKERLKEPSTWAGIGLVIQGAVQAYATGGADMAAWATIAAGMAAIIKPEARPVQAAPAPVLRRRGSGHA
jgi:hypothetical protein